MQPKNRSTKVIILVCAIALLVFGILFNFPSVSDAAALLPPVFTVNSTGDTSDGSCQPIGTGNGCTLREAITLANSNAGDDTIAFDSTVFAAPGPHVIQLTSALPDLASNITINGPGTRVLTVRGEGASHRYRIFNITSGVVHISGLTVTNGYTADGVPGQNGEHGGGIQNGGTLTLTGVAIVGNKTGNGGSMANAGGVGGGIRNFGTLTVTNCTISGNQTGDGGTSSIERGGPGGNGGAIHNGGAGLLTITNSTISGNSTGAGGIGVLNGEPGSGGGIVSATSPIVISNSTITANSGSVGGGIWTQGGAITLRSTIVATNSANIAGPDIFGAVQSDGFNLIGNTTDATINQNTGAGPTITNVDPQLNSLANNGGPTNTHSLKSTSPAIDHGNAFGTTTDGRGSTRPVNQADATYPNAAGGDASDIGAYEAQSTDTQIFPLIVNTTADTDDGACTTIGNGNGCTLREAITAANLIPGTETITFDTTVFASAQTITLVSVLPDISTNMIIDGPGAALLSVNGNNMVRGFKVLSGATVTIQDLTIRNGKAIGSDGGGIQNAGALVLANVAINGSSANSGGAVANSGSLTTLNSSFSNNSVPGAGGGVFNTGALVATNSTFNNNQADVGGGIFTTAVATLTNCTLSGNSVTTSGGGISNSNLLVLRNTIIANSTGGDCNGPAATAFNSLVEDGTCGVTNGVNGNLTGVDPLLEPLTGTPAYFPLSGYSPARNAGNNLFVTEADDDGAGVTDFAVDYNGDGDTNDTLTTDQSGATRVANSTVDMGSTEVSVIVVNLTTNVSDTNTSDGVCDTDAAAGEQCTLRAAIQTANANAGTETIIFDPSVFATAQNISIPSAGLPTISSSMNIAGPGEALLTLTGGGGTRLFTTNAGVVFSLEGMTIAGSSSLNGGAMFNQGALTISHVTFSNNTATNTANGGAIYTQGGSLRVSDSTFTGNTAGGSGGAIHNQTGTVRISNSTFTNNTSNETGPATGGGAIYINSSSSLTAIGSSFINNSVSGGGYGGAIMVVNSPGVITNCTFGNNSAGTGGGGAINATNAGANITLTNSTISGNTAAAGLGGGIRRAAGSNFTIRNTIIANSNGGDCATTSGVPSLANSLIEDGSCGALNEANGNTLGDPALGALTNGYFPLTSGSRARDAGNNNFLSETTTGLDYNGDGDTNDILTTDQAGETRVSNSTVDMGAKEFLINFAVVDRTDDSAVNNCTAAPNDCSLRGAMTLANSRNGLDVITFDPTVFASATTITLGAALPNITTPMTIDGSGTGGVNISGVDSHRPFIIQGTMATIQNVTIRDGSAPGGQGGCVQVATGSNLTLRHVNVTGCAASGGGGIYTLSGSTVFVFDSTISSNHVNNNGGGILAAGFMYMMNTAVLDNSANGQGGGIHSTSSANLTNVTVSGNSANFTAGIYLSNGTSTLTNVTVAGNSASTLNGGVQRFSGTVVVRNSIFANNTGADCYNTMAVTNSLVETQDGSFPCGVTNGVGGNIVGQDPQLGTFDARGFYPLNAGSPARDAGNNLSLNESNGAVDFNGDGDTVDVLTVDQAGNTRVVNSVVDMGAIEALAPPSISDITDKTIAEDTAVPQITFNVSGGSTGIQSVTANSSNTSLIPNANLVIGGSGSTRTLDVTPWPDANSPASGGPATITVTLTATNGSTAVDTFVVRVTEVNDAPVPTDDPIGDVLEDSGVNVIPFSTVLANDANKGASNEIQQVTLTGVSNPVGGTVQINGTNIEFTPAPNYFGPASFVYTVTDDGTTNGVPDPKSGNATARFNVTGVNEPPVNTVPGPQYTNQDTPLTFSSGNGNQISVIDSDSFTSSSMSKRKGGIQVSVSPSGSGGLFDNLMQITLSVTHGTLTLNGTAGLNFTFSDFKGTGAGDGTADATMTFRGSIADVNNALNGLIFTPSAGFSGQAVLTITSNDLGNTGASGASLTDTDSVNIQVSNDIRVQDARLTEPASGTANLVFTVVLSQPAGASGVQVTYQSTSGGANPATPGSDYNNVGPTVLTFTAGQRIKTVAVPVLSDSDNTETNETLLLNLSSPVNGTIVDATGTGTITPTGTPGTFIISELRTSGPAGPGDDFVEFYNNSDSPITVAATDASAGYGLFVKGADCDAMPILVGVIPNGTVIPARGHYLMVGSQYSLSGYAAGNLTLSSDIESDANVAVFSTSNVGSISSTTALDAVGFGTNTGGVCDLLREGTNIAATGGPTIEYSFHRDSCGKGGSSALMGACTTFTPVDNNNNSSDFLFADTQGTAIAGHPQRLGSPGPENLASPILRNNSISALLLDQSVAQAAAPNRVRDLTPVTNGTFGTMSFRRRIQNNTGGNVTRLRFRIIDITTFPATSGLADLRALDSLNVVLSGVNDPATCLAANGVATTPCSVTVAGTTLEASAAQPNGGAWNSTYAAGTITLGTPLANGASANLQFLLGVQQTGTFKFYINIEALP